MMRYGRTLLALSVIGIIISAYLTIEHYSPGILYCPGSGSGGIINCGAVLSSSYSTILGIPISIGALVWFAGSLFLALRKPNKTPLLLWSLAGVGGITYSITAMAVIGKICIWCSSLDVLILITTALFLLQ